MHSDGTISIQQPMIAPLHGGRSDIEVLANLAGIEFWRGHPLVRTTVAKAAEPPAFFQYERRRGNSLMTQE